jgi:exodeoxyribonuclease VII small subunit
MTAKKRAAKVDEGAESETSGARETGMDEASAENVTLEERLLRLDAIVAALEGGEIDLEKGLALFEEGVRHIRSAEALLSRAELRVEELIGEVESLSTKPFKEGQGSQR